VPRILAAAALLAATPLAAQADGDLLARTECAPLTPYDQVAALANATRRPLPPEAEYRRLERAAVCERLVYSSDGLRIVAIMVRPREVDGRRLPVLIYNHGGSAAQGALPEGVQMDQARWAAAGYLYIASQYRGGGGSQGVDEGGGADVHDVLNLYPLLRGLGYADTSAIYMLGYSRGGAMTYQVIRAGMPVRAAVTVAGVAEYHFPRINAARTDSVNAERERERSALSWPDRIRVPVLLIHGEADEVVPVDQSRRLAAELARLGVVHDLVVVRGADHGMSGRWDDIRRRAMRWFQRNR
jgi:dipeptidyl aminopeptidase/acylaminoacyl peptidase